MDNKTLSELLESSNLDEKEFVRKKILELYDLLKNIKETQYDKKASNSDH